jgi:hypothetical protein
MLTLNPTIWVIGSRLHHYTFVDVMRSSTIEEAKQVISNSGYTTFELVVYLISTYIAKRDVPLWEYMVRLLSKDDATKTFLVPSCKEEHTLLTYLCKEINRHEKIKQKIWPLLALGCQWDQVVQTNKTALSWLVTSDSHLEIIKWGVMHKANVHKGHVLIYASNRISKEEQAIKMEFSGSEIGKPFQNNAVFDYLIHLGVDVHDVLDDGTTPLLAACCEGNVHKVSNLLSRGAYLYSKTNEELDVWFWAEQFRGVQGSRLREVLFQYESKQTKYWTEMVHEVMDESSILKDVPIHEVLMVLSTV